MAVVSKFDYTAVEMGKPLTIGLIIQSKIISMTPDILMP
jgi:hypothetical protein